MWCFYFLVCNPLFPDVNYEAQSTDEVALVKCAAENGYVFLERSMRDLVVEIDGIFQPFPFPSVWNTNTTWSFLVVVH